MIQGKEVEHIGKIIAIEENCIRVEIVNKSLCAGCHAKSVCALGDSKDKVIDIPYYNNGEYSVGEEVYVKTGRSMGFRAVWISYVIPVTILLVFLLTLSGYNLKELWIGVISLFAVAVYYLVIYLFKERIATQFVFKIAKKTVN